MLKSLNKKYFIGVLAATLLVAVAVLLFTIRSSNGLLITDAQAIYRQSLLSLDVDSTVIKTTVTEGQHPWAFLGSEVALGGDSSQARTILDSETNSLLIYDSGEEVKVIANDKEVASGISFSYSQSTELQKYLELLSASGVINNLNDLLIFEVESTADSSTQFSITTKKQVTLPTLIELAELEHSFTDLMPHRPVEVSLVSGEVLIDEDTGVFESATLEYDYNQTLYQVEITIIPEFSRDITNEVETLSFDELKQTNEAQQLAIADSFIGGSLARQLEDNQIVAGQTYIVDAISSFAKENLYYPTKIDLKTYLIVLNPDDTTDLTNYTPLPEDCDNKTDDSFCDNYEIVLDLSFDGYGSADSDNDLRDVVITP